jgi:putative zinc finger protein
VFLEATLKGCNDRMESKRRLADDGLICIRTDTRCTNNKVGFLVGRYLHHQLSPEQKLAFEHHLSECIACDSTVLNWESLKFASARISGAVEGTKGQAFKAGK